MTIPIDRLGGESTLPKGEQMKVKKGTVKMHVSGLEKVKTYDEHGVRPAFIKGCDETGGDP